MHGNANEWTGDLYIENYYHTKNGLFHYFDGKAHHDGLLSDNIYFLNCLIDAYFITQNQKYFQ